MTEDIDWEKVAKNFQIENEILRGQIKFYPYNQPQRFSISLGPVLKDMITWIEAHPFAVIAIFYVLSTLMMDVVDISMKVRSAA